MQEVAAANPDAAGAFAGGMAQATLLQQAK